MKMIVKEWFANKIDEEAKRYNTWLDLEYDENDVAMYGHYANAEIIKETEKAYQVKFSSGSVVGSAKGWTTWVPKSVVISAE